MRKGSLAVLAASLLLAAACSGTPKKISSADIPRAEASGMEPQVAAHIEEARMRIMEEPTAESWGELGMRLHAHAFHAEAATAYQRAAMSDPDDGRWPYLEAVCRATLDPRAALPLFQRAAGLGLSSAGFHVRYGDALAGADQATPAAHQYGRALESDPESTHALHGLARIDLRSGDHDAAAARLEKAIGLAPHHGELHRTLAQVYQRQGREEEAARSAENAATYTSESTARDETIQAVRQRAVSSRAYTDRGLALARQGEWAEAEAAFRKVIEIRPANARDLTNLGSALTRQGKRREALTHFRRALALNPEDSFGHGNLGFALLEEGLLADAERHLQRAVEIDPLYADGWSNLGLLREAQGRPVDAREAYGRALETIPGHGTALNNLARLEAARGSAARAEELWKRAAEFDPLNLDARYNLAVLQMREGRHADAIATLRQGAARAPNSSLIARLLAWELATAPDASLRDGKSAVEIASRVFSRYPESVEIADVYAAALAEAGRFEEAARMALRATQNIGDENAHLAQGIRRRLALYQAGRPFHQPGS